MLRLCIILVIGLLSCHQSSTEKYVVVEDIITTDTDIDSSSIMKGAFGWRKWEKPSGGRFIYLPNFLLRYVTDGHVAIDGSYADVNEDGNYDIVIITAPVNEDSVSLSRGDLSRDLLIFLRQKNDSLILVEKNSKSIPHFNSCDSIDSFAGHTALTGRLIINKSCTNRHKIHSEYRFGYDSKLNNWLLDTIITASYPSNNDEYVMDTITNKDFGNVSLNNFDINKGYHKIR